MIAGMHGAYHWLEIEGALEDLLARNPDIVMGRYLAITAADCCRERDVWREEGGIVYSPRIASIPDLKRVWFEYGTCSGLSHPYSEGYVFDGPVTLAGLSRDNVFESQIGAERVFPFVSFLGFHLSPTGDSMEYVADLFWEQLEWIRPAAYVASGEGRSYLVTADRALFYSCAGMPIPAQSSSAGP